MKIILLILLLIVFGCSMEKRLHRPGFHIKKNLVSQSSGGEKHKSSLAEEENSVDIISPETSVEFEVEQLKKEHKSRLKQELIKRNHEEVEIDTISLLQKESIIKIKEHNDKEINHPVEKKIESNTDLRKPDKETEALVVIANILSIMSFVFAILTIVLIAMAFIMSLTLILPVLPALGAFFSGGLSLILGLPLKHDNYKSRYATIGLITSLIFFGFLIAVLYGVILI